MLSQLPVHIAIPSDDTPRQDTLLSCAVNTPTRSALRVSQTLQLKSSYPANNSRPDTEKATEVIPHKMLSCVNWLSSLSARRSKRRQDASSEPVPKASPLGKNLKINYVDYATALISDSWPVKVWTQRPVLISQILAVASQAADTKMFLSGLKERLITSPLWSENSNVFIPASISHSMQVISPDDEIICRSEINLQHDR